MTRKYKLEVVKGDKVIEIRERNNHESQRISEVQFSLSRGRPLSLKDQEIAEGIKDYSLL